MLATLKAGGAYVPIDPSHPEARVRLILEDAAPEVLIAPAQSPLAAALPAATRLLRSTISRPRPRISTTRRSSWRCDPDQLAYILFTSGSTGRPKGVEITRGCAREPDALDARSAGHLAQRIARWRSPRPRSTSPASSCSCRCASAPTCVIADRETALDPRRLRALLERATFSVLQATPATWRMLVEAGWNGDGRLRMLIGGEALSPELRAALLERGAELWNMYGPTETTVYSTGRRRRARRGAHRDRPADRSHADLHARPGAAARAARRRRRDLHRRRGRRRAAITAGPDLTEQRFVPDPFGAVGASCIAPAISGACSRRQHRVPRPRRSSGQDPRLPHRARRDRVGAASDARRARSGRRRGRRQRLGRRQADRVLDRQRGARRAVRQCARAKLPQYMVPACVRAHRRVPAHDQRQDRSQGVARARDDRSPPRADLRLPGEPLERRVAAIWSEVLGITPIGVDQDFFASAGARSWWSRLRDRIERELSAQLPLRVFFEAPTIEGIVRALEQAALPRRAARRAWCGSSRAAASAACS